MSRNPRSTQPLLGGAAALLVFTGLFGVAAATHPEPPQPIAPPARIAEARARARLLHEMVHGTLQVMHRDFFDEDVAAAIPSASLEDVFHELDKAYDVRLKWLVIDTDVVNVDHQPSSELERRAATALRAGEPFFDHAEEGRYTFAGPIRLGATCLKCHVKRRSDNSDRTAGLLITMPLTK